MSDPGKTSDPPFLVLDDNTLGLAGHRLRRVTGLVAARVDHADLVTEGDPEQEAEAESEVAEGEVHDGSLRVLKPGGWFISLTTTQVKVAGTFSKSYILRQANCGCRHRHRLMSHRLCSR